MWHLIFCFRHDTQAVILRLISGSLRSPKCSRSVLDELVSMLLTKSKSTGLHINPHRHNAEPLVITSIVLSAVRISSGIDLSNCKLQILVRRVKLHYRQGF